MTLSDILARADEPVWATNVTPYPTSLVKALAYAELGDILCQVPEGDVVATVVCMITQGLLDAIEAHGEG